MGFGHKNHEWRRHPLVSVGSNLRGSIPGFGTAVILFGAYCIAEGAFSFADKSMSSGEKK